MDSADPGTIEAGGCYPRTDIRYPDGLIYRLTVVGALHPKSLTSLSTSLEIHCRPENFAFFRLFGTRVFRLQNERQWTSWEA